MIRIDDYPTHEKNGIRFRCGRVQPFGASIVGGGGINFSIFSKDAVSCELLLYHHGAPEPYAVLPFPEEFRIGNVWGTEPDWEKPFQHRGCVIPEDYDWEGDKPLEIPMRDLVIYEMHVRALRRMIRAA